MSGLRELQERLRRFLVIELWDLDAGNLSQLRRAGVRLLQITTVVARDFIKDRCLLRASALTYTTLLSIVPLLALMFSVLKGLNVQNSLQPFLLEHLAAGAEEVATAIIDYINNTHFGRLGAVGLVALVFTVLALIANIEESFNEIWGVRETRSLFRRFADFSSVVLLGPLFIIAAISMTTSLETHVVIERLGRMAFLGDLLLLTFKVIPFLVMWLVFTGLYLFMPNTKVDLRAALLGGIVGGTLWQLAQNGYVAFQFGVSRYNAIYGTMAALPIFMVWLYISWVIVLFGLEVTYAVQNIRAIRRELKGQNVSFACRELAALTVLLVTAETFHRGGPPWTLDRLSEELKLPIRFARDLIDELVRLNYLAEVRIGEGQPGYQPAQAPERLVVFEVIQSLRDDGEAVALTRDVEGWKVMRGLEDELRHAERQVLEGITLRDLVLELAPEAGAVPTSPERAAPARRLRRNTG